MEERSLYEEAFDSDFLAEEPLPQEEIGPVAIDRTDLLYLGYIEEEIEVAGYSFVLKTLNVEEELECYRLIRGMGAEVLPVEQERSTVTALLAGAILSLDGNPLVEELEPGDPKVIQKKLKIIRRWHWPIHEELWRVYMSLDRRKRAALRDLEKKSQRTLTS